MGKHLKSAEEIEKMDVDEVEIEKKVADLEI